MWLLVLKLGFLSLSGMGVLFVVFLEFKVGRFLVSLFVVGVVDFSCLFLVKGLIMVEVGDGMIFLNLLMFEFSVFFFCLMLVFLKSR